MTADLPDGYTATLGTPSGDAQGVEVPGWWMKPDGSKHAGRCKFYDEAHERYEQEDA